MRPSEYVRHRGVLHQPHTIQTQNDVSAFGKCLNKARRTIRSADSIEKCNVRLFECKVAQACVTSLLEDFLYLSVQRLDPSLDHGHKAKKIARHVQRRHISKMTPFPYKSHEGRVQCAAITANCDNNNSSLCDLLSKASATS